MRILTVILLLASTISFSAFADDNKAGTKPKLLSFITSDNTQTQLMGMVLSLQALKANSLTNLDLPVPEIPANRINGLVWIAVLISL